MAAQRPPKRNRRPASTPEGRENQLINLAVEVAEEQLRNRTASSQVITHFLKLATERESLEREKLRREVEVLQAKVSQLASAKKVEELYELALAAMRRYSGQEPME